MPIKKDKEGRFYAEYNGKRIGRAYKERSKAEFALKNHEQRVKKAEQKKKKKGK